jgi:hypothetical protein
MGQDFAAFFAGGIENIAVVTAASVVNNKNVKAGDTVYFVYKRQKPCIRFIRRNQYCHALLSLFLFMNTPIIVKVEYRLFIVLAFLKRKK